MVDQSIERTVKNPKLTLIAFQLRNNLALGDEPIETADHLWKKCRELGKILNCPQLETLIDRLDQHQGKIGFPPGVDDISNDYVELLKSDRSFGSDAIPDPDKPQLQGEVYPLQIHDTYAIDITFRRPEVVNLSEFNYFLNPNLW